MTTELHEGPLEEAPIITQARPSWREQRRIRRRRRVWFEEILAWILVPVIVVACYWGIEIGMEALGTSPAAIMDGIHAVLNAL